MSAGLIAGTRCCTDVKECASFRDEAGQLQVGRLHPAHEWSRERFAEEQIFRLARNVFSTAPMAPVRQVIFTTASCDIDVWDLSRKVAQVFAQQGLGEIALLSTDPDLAAQTYKLPLKQIARQLATNLWSIKVPGWNVAAGQIESLYRYVRAIRAEFEYSIVAVAADSNSESAIDIGQLADGVVLVLSAQKTRRAAALKIKQALDERGVRLLGTILIDREFPVPERVYRNL
jgi:hypothetical protein